MIENLQTELPRQLEAIRYAAQKLGYNVREVAERTDKILVVLGLHPDAATVRQYVINMRGWDMPPQFGTCTFLDLQLERLIDMLATDADRAEEAALAARLVTAR